MEVSSCLRLIHALAVELHENWFEARSYLNIGHVWEHKKEPAAWPPEPKPAEDNADPKPFS